MAREADFTVVNIMIYIKHTKYTKCNELLSKSEARLRSVCKSSRFINYPVHKYTIPSKRSICNASHKISSVTKKGEEKISSLRT